MTREELKAFLASVVALREGAADREASAAPDIYPALHADGRLIRAGTRIRIGGRLMRAAVDLNDTAENAPDRAPALWEEIDYVEGVRKIPKAITPGLQFSRGEKGWWKGRVYESLADANTWTPEEHPALWREREKKL